MIIKSSIRDYSISFQEYKNFLEQNYNDSDIVICDEILNLELPKNTKIIRVSASEYIKEYTKITEIVNYLIEFGFKKENKIIAIGGGVVQDIVCFISSILYRGVEWYFIPTTLLSQGDSCIGGKSSVNFLQYKNQLGGFYPPSKICIDTRFIETLPTNQIDSGLGEMLHYFIFSSIEDTNLYLELYDKQDYQSLIKRSLEIKQSVIEQDEKELGIRKLFNYGHTFGHAIESITNYEIPHGIAVAHGMQISNFISHEKGFLDSEKFNFLNSVTSKITKKYDLPNFDTNRYFEIIKKDKKNTVDKIRPILIRDLGNLFQHEFTYNGDLLFLIEKYFNS